MSSIIARLRRALDYLETPALLEARRKGVRVDFVAELIDLRDRFGVRPRTVVDVGANQGEFVRAVRFVHPEAKVHAFEPLPELAQRIRTEQGSDRVEVFSCALDERDGTTELFVPSSEDLSSFLPPTARLSSQFGVEAEAASIQVETRRLDGLLDLLQAARPVLLKLDVQGAELRVLRGAERQLAGVDVIKLEFSFDSFYEGQTRLGDLFSFLTSHGFSRFFQVGSVVAGGRIRWCDFVFFREATGGGGAP